MRAEMTKVQEGLQELAAAIADLSRRFDEVSAQQSAVSAAWRAAQPDLRDRLDKIRHKQRNLETVALVVLHELETMHPLPPKGG